MIEEEFENADSFGEFIRYAYYKVLPYDWRPSNIWYKIKCTIWHRYTTVKPRQLDNTWCDRCTLMPHMMFEILSQFLEKECSPGIVDWDASDHEVMYGGHSRNAEEVMWHLCYWWHEVHLVKKELNYDSWHKYSEAHTLNLPSFDAVWNPEFVSDAHEQHAAILFKRAGKKEAAIIKELNENLKVIVDLIPYLWT